ncbi:DUF4435 domain-containing protein [Idiomarina loihiensis]|uniref:DUF4435 domain-containing protein n=1 Tax=Idiomarina loihiensis TaxID=135577 RepID=UPI00315970A6
MRETLTYEDLVNQIKMLLAHPKHHNKLFMVVEGDSDLKLFRSILKNESLEIESFKGKTNVIRILQSLNEDYPDSVIGVCDSDFDNITGDSENHLDYQVYVTCHHDSEVMMLNSKALDSLIDEYADPNAHQQLHDRLLDAAFKVAYKLGVLRWVNHVEDLKIRFKALSLVNHVNVNNLEVDISIDDVIEELIDKSVNCRIGQPELKGLYQDYLDRDEDKFQICCGHDLTAIIAIILRQRTLSIDANINVRSIEQGLRLGYQKRFFDQTLLAETLYKLFEERNVTV